MFATLKEIEKRYIKLEEPLLNNVKTRLFRLLIWLMEKDPSYKANFKIYPNISMKKKSNRPTNTSKPERLRDIGQYA